jgi:symplekin
LSVPKPDVPANDTNGDFEDYDPEDTMPVTLDTKPDDDLDEPIPDEDAIVAFELPPPSKLPAQAIKQEFSASVDRIISSIHTMDTYIPHRAGLAAKSLSLDSLAITEWDKDAWIIILSRLSSRLPQDSEVGSTLKERLFEYIMINFREHMDLTISWLTEEWYSDKLNGSGNYEKWANRIFDNILPFVEMKDMKMFIRFLGDLPFVTAQQVAKLRTLCLDPERIRLGFASIKYLLMLRPPARASCVELCVDLYRNRKIVARKVADLDADTKKSAADLLKRHAPEVMDS